MNSRPNLSAYKSFIHLGTCTLIRTHTDLCTHRGRVPVLSTAESPPIYHSALGILTSIEMMINVFGAQRKRGFGSSRVAGKGERDSIGIKPDIL